MLALLAALGPPRAVLRRQIHVTLPLSLSSVTASVCWFGSPYFLQAPGFSRLCLSVVLWLIRYCTVANIWSMPNISYPYMISYIPPCRHVPWSQAQMPSKSGPGRGLYILAIVHKTYAEHSLNYPIAPNQQPLTNPGSHVYLVPVLQSIRAAFL